MVELILNDTDTVVRTGTIDLPSEKDKIWHAARTDLQALVPWFQNNDLILCPTCCRPVSFDEMSIEHILPQQALKRDPKDVREAVEKNRRAGLTLLCRKPLVYKGNRIPGAGCNSWKGKYYDSFLRDLLSSDISKLRINSRHQVAVFSAGYLALFREYGYQISLSQAGLTMRQQFFHPNGFVRKLPARFQAVLGGKGPDRYSDRDKAYWNEPFRISVGTGAATIAIRNMAFLLPLTHDPRKAFAKVLPYAPAHYRFRPDLSTMFD